MVSQCALGLRTCVKLIGLHEVAFFYHRIHRTHEATKEAVVGRGGREGGVNEAGRGVATAILSQSRSDSLTPALYVHTTNSKSPLKWTLIHIVAHMRDDSVGYRLSSSAG